MQSISGISVKRRLTVNFSRILTAAFFLLALALGSHYLVAQEPSRSTSAGVVEGHVLCSDGGTLARGAKVELIPLSSLLPAVDGAKKSPESGEKVSTTADFDGYYLLSSVKPGLYLVHASSAGYLDDLKLVRAALPRFDLDQQKALLGTFPQITVSAGGSIRKDLVLRRGGTISGRVTVDIGGTVPTTSVEAKMVSSKLIGAAEGSATAKPIEFSVLGTLDDRGVYRIAGLPPGKYRLEVPIRQGFYDFVLGKNGSASIVPARPGIIDMTVYAPEALTPGDAKLIQVDEGDEVSDADITIPRRRLHSIGGTVIKNGNPLSRASISVHRPGDLTLHYDAVSQDDGSYRFDLLAPGTYTVEAKEANPSSSGLQPTGVSKTVEVGDSDLLEENLDLTTGK